MSDRAREAEARIDRAYEELVSIPGRALTAVEARVLSILEAPWETGNYGFAWGPMEVMRATVYRGTYVLLVKTDTQELEIAVSPQGNSVRAWLNRKKMEVQR